MNGLEGESHSVNSLMVPGMISSATTTYGVYSQMIAVSSETLVNEPDSLIVVTMDDALYIIYYCKY